MAGCWEARITHTTKVSTELRTISLRKSTEYVSYLEQLRVRAIRYASPDSIVALARAIPLAESGDDDDDAKELQDSAQRSDFPWLVELDQKIDELYDIGDTWFGSLDQITDDGLLDPTDQEGGISDLFSGNDPRFIQSSLSEWNTTGHVSYGETSPFILSRDSQEEKTQADEKNTNDFLSIPWQKGFPFRLGQYLDCIEFFESEELFEHRESNPSPYRNVETAGVIKDTNDKIRSNIYPVSETHLLKLQGCISQIRAFRNYLKKSVEDIRDASNRREDRYRMREARGDITMLMHTRGYGSALVECISTEETWPEEEASWGLPPIKKLRKKLYMSSIGEESSLAAETRNVRW